MYNASTAFRDAVYAHSPSERLLITFADGTILTGKMLDLAAQGH
jgi:hypothetical protein